MDGSPSCSGLSSAPGMSLEMRGKINLAIVEMDKVCKMTEKLVEAALNDQQKRRSEAFQKNVVATTDAVQDLSSANKILTDMLKFNRNADKTPATQKSAQEQYEVCKVSHGICKEQYNILKSLLRG